MRKTRISMGVRRIKMTKISVELVGEDRELVVAKDSMGEVAMKVGKMWKMMSS
jgi:hypothetical protein